MLETWQKVAALIIQPSFSCSLDSVHAALRRCRHKTSDVFDPSSLESLDGSWIIFRWEVEIQEHEG